MYKLANTRLNNLRTVRHDFSSFDRPKRILVETEGISRKQFYTLHVMQVHAE